MTPPFATAAYAAAIWIGVTAIPCPIGTLPIVAPVQRDGGMTIPALSPGKSIPVLCPKPNLEIHQETSRVGCLVSSSASVIAPTFEECERICSTE